MNERKREELKNIIYSLISMKTVLLLFLYSHSIPFQLFPYTFSFQLVSHNTQIMDYLIWCSSDDFCLCICASATMTLTSNSFQLSLHSFHHDVARAKEREWNSLMRQERIIFNIKNVFLRFFFIQCKIYKNVFNSNNLRFDKWIIKNTQWKWKWTVRWYQKLMQERGEFIYEDLKTCVEIKI